MNEADCRTGGLGSFPGATREVMRQKNKGARLGHVSLAVDQICEMDVDPLIKARMPRELAVWYRALAPRAANPAIWESRLLTAEDLDAEARCLERQQGA